MLNVTSHELLRGVVRVVSPFEGVYLVDNYEATGSSPTLDSFVLSRRDTRQLG